MKKYTTAILTLLLMVIVLDTMNAQRRRRSRERNTTQETKASFSDNLNYEIRFGNLAFGSGFALDFKPSVGYKINKYITAGGGYRIDYDFINGITNDFSLFSHGPFILARGKILQNFYLQGEYTLFNFDTINGNNFSRNFPSAGVGYMQGGDNWKFNLEGMFILDETSRRIFNNTVEFWFVFSKNF